MSPFCGAGASISVDLGCQCRRLTQPFEVGLPATVWLMDRTSIKQHEDWTNLVDVFDMFLWVFSGLSM